MNFINLKMKGNKFIKINVSIPERLRNNRATITGNLFTDQEFFPQQPTLLSSNQFSSTTALCRRACPSQVRPLLDWTKHQALKRNRNCMGKFSAKDAHRNAPLSRTLALRCKRHAQVTLPLCLCIRRAQAIPR